MVLPQINIVIPKNYHVAETLRNLKGPDNTISSMEEATAIHEYYISMRNKKDVGKDDIERLILANRSAENYLLAGRNENFWTLISDAYHGMKKLYTRYLSGQKDNKELANKE